MDSNTPSNHNYKHKQRIRARHLARRSSDVFCESFGDSTALDSIAPFERDEIIVGRKVGSGSFSDVYEITAFTLRPDQSSVYTKEQVMMREALAKSVSNGATYVMKCLKDELEDSDDQDLFLDAAQDISREAEMLASLSHPNIVSLHGISADRHDAFLSGASAFFIILEKLDVLSDKINAWKKGMKKDQKQRRTLSLSSSLSSSSKEVDKISKALSAATVEEDGSINSRLRAAISLANVLDYLHSRGVMFRDLKPDNIGFDMFGNIKLFDFGLSKCIPPYGDFYDDVYEMSIAGSPRYTAPEVIFEDPYNLKADVYSFAVILWELMSLKQPFKQYKRRSEFYKAILNGKALGINRKWPLPVQDIIQRSLSRDLKVRPTMSEVCHALKGCVPKGVEYADTESISTLSSTRNQISKSFAFPRLSSRRIFRAFSSSSTTASSTQTT